MIQVVKNPPAMWETWVWSLGWEDSLEEGMATHSGILAWRIPWTEEPGKACAVTKHSTCLRIPLLRICPRERKAYVCADLSTSVHSGFICNCWKLETTQMSTKGRIDKHIVVYISEYIQHNMGKSRDNDISKRSQTQKNIYYMIPFIGNLKM